MQIKLIIWDLDDTLWKGTLADGDDVQIHQKRAGILRQLNSHGIVSSICSKNDFEAAKDRLTFFDLWDQVVFPRISFSSKSVVVAEIIEDMQLRPVNVLFVDDNPHNLHEVKHHLPDINILDATNEECDAVLEQILDDNKAIRKSRVDEYRNLEKKTADRKSNGGSPEDFLRSCDLHLAVGRRGDIVPFAERIEELINRSNQLNFTKSRVKPGSIRTLLLSPWARVDTWAMFAWDRYGYHGLVGFAAVSKKTKLLHFVFSCRIMHMGVEEFLLDVISKRHKKLNFKNLPMKPRSADWVTYKRFEVEPTRSYVLEKEKKATDTLQNPSLHIMLDCQSAGIAHFGGLSDVAETDLFPRRFQIKTMLNAPVFGEKTAPVIVYGAFTDYVDGSAPRRKWDVPTYKQCASNFSKAIADSNRKALIILPPRSTKKFQKKKGVTRGRVNVFNGIWEGLACENPNMEILNVSEIGAPKAIIDVRHYDTALIKKLAGKVADWYFGLDTTERRAAE